MAYTEACLKTYKALKHSKQKLVDEKVRKERGEEPGFQHAEAAKRAKKCHVEVQENETTPIMANAIASPAVGTPSALIQGVDHQRFMRELYSGALAITFLPVRLRQSAAREGLLEAFMDNHSRGQTNILGNGQGMLAVPKYQQQGLPPSGLSTQRIPAALNLPQYVLKNWQEKLRDSYQYIPETKLPRKEMFPCPKRAGERIAAGKKKNRKRPWRSNESSSEDEHDRSSSDEEEGPEKPTGTVVPFDDGRKWRVERVGNVHVLSPYM